MPDISNMLVEQVESALQNQTPLNICGGGSKSFLGREPKGVELHTREHTGIVNYQPEELVLTARSGTRLNEIEATLAEHRQMLAFEPPHFSEDATIGGTLACNLSGPSRPWQGSVRDHVLGVRLINGRAEHLRFGGQVMKNVAGYDVSRLQAGAFGTLGVLTEVSLKVLPMPAATQTLVYEIPADAAIKQMNQHAGSSVPLTAACWFDGKMYLRLSGTVSAVNAATGKLGGERLSQPESFWQQLREQQLSFFNNDTPLWRFSVNSTASHTFPEALWIIDWSGTQRWLQGDYEMDALVELALKQGGHVSRFRSNDCASDVFQQPSSAAKKLQQNLKQAFDPQGMFNPGRLYSWL